jgi:hypothetical protein
MTPNRLEWIKRFSSRSKSWTIKHTRQLVQEMGLTVYNTHPAVMIDYILSDDIAILRKVQSKLKTHGIPSRLLYDKRKNNTPV